MEKIVGMLYYIDVIIPLAGGIFLLTGGDWLVNETDVSSQKKRRTLRLLSWALIGLSVIYLVVKIAVAMNR